MFDFMNTQTVSNIISEHDWKEIHRRILKYEAGKSKGYSLPEMKKQINALRKI